jgi:pimeloyl-ACP methyl ester carboxylesterase
MNSWKITLAVKSLNTLSYVFPSWVGRVAFRIFRKPMKGKLSTEDQSFLNQSTIKQLTIKDLSIQTYDWISEGKTILLAHGWNSNTARWRNLIALLRGVGLRVVALDAPAHGGSSGVFFDVITYAHCLREAISKFQPFAVVGHSAGGMALAYCLKYFEDKAITNLKKAVLMGVPSDLSDLMDNYVQSTGFNQRIRKALDYHIEQATGEPTAAFSVLRFTPFFPSSLQGLVIHDSTDTVARFDHAKEIAKNWAAAQWFASTNLGHSLQDEKIYKQIINFLKS